MKVVNNQIVEFVAISWSNPNWEFDYPSALLYPVVKSYESGISPETIIEDEMIHLCCNLDLMQDDEYVKWNKSEIAKLKKVAKDRLNGNTEIWKTKFYCVSKQKIKFTKSVEDSGFDFEIIENKTIQI